MLQITDRDRVRTITLDRPEALNAFNEALYDATAEALLAAADDPGVAVVLLTGNGRGFSAGTDLLEMHRIATDPTFVPGKHGFLGLLDALVAFPKPLVCAVNGVGLGIGATILGFADLAFMSTTARLKCPFTTLGVAPEAASSYLLPAAARPPGRRVDAALRRWVSAAEAQEMGLVWRVCEPDDLLPEATRHAELLARRPISSLVAVKRTHDRAAARRDRRRPRARERRLRRADGRAGQPRGPDRVRRGPRAGLHRPAAGVVTPAPVARCRRGWRVRRPAIVEVGQESAAGWRVQRLQYCGRVTVGGSSACPEAAIAAVRRSSRSPTCA